MNAELIRAIIKEELAPIKADIETIQQNVDFLKWTLTPMESKMEAQIESFNSLKANLDYLKWTVTPMDAAVKSIYGDVHALKEAQQQPES